MSDNAEPSAALRAEQYKRCTEIFERLLADHTLSAAAVFAPKLDDIYALIDAGYRAGAARVGMAREPVAVPPVVLDALRLYVLESAAFSMGESNDAASAEADFAIVAKTWLLAIDAAREQPPQRAADTGGAEKP